MSPNNFEEQFRELLHQREIAPSEGAWDRLQQRMRVSSRAAVMGYGRWVAVTAAAAVLVLVMVLEKNPEVDKVPTVVEETSLQRPLEVSPQEGTELVSQQPSTSPEKEASNSRRAAVPAISSSLKLLPIIPARFSAPERMPHIVTVPKNFSAPQAVTDAEIEALLMAAREELSQQPAYATETITAEHLLEEVEYEMNQTFRQKVLEVIQEGINKARTAVANRNF